MNQFLRWMEKNRQRKQYREHVGGLENDESWHEVQSISGSAKVIY